MSYITDARGDPKGNDQLRGGLMTHPRSLIDAWLGVNPLAAALGLAPGVGRDRKQLLGAAVVTACSDGVAQDGEGMDAALLAFAADSARSGTEPQEGPGRDRAR